MANPEDAHICTQLFTLPADKNKPSPKPWDRDTLSVKFMPQETDIDMVCKSYIIKYAKEWENFGNIKFFFVDSGNADIRISFELHQCYCFVGSTAASIDQDKPTMNFGWKPDDFDDSNHMFRQTVLHLFGHALGMIHVRKSPIIRWNNVIYDYYWDVYKWSRDYVDAEKILNYEYDPSSQTLDNGSIMLYWYDSIMTGDRSSISLNKSISDKDKSFVLINYPNYMADIGVFTTDMIRSNGSATAINSAQMKFSARYAYPPAIFVGITLMDADCDDDMRLQVKADQISVNGFTAHADTWSDTHLFRAGLTWVELPRDNPRFRTGEISIKPLKENKETQIISFNGPNPYNEPPNVVVWLSRINFGRKVNPIIHAYAQAGSVTTEGFQVCVEYGKTTKLYDCTVQYLAYSKDAGIQSGRQQLYNYPAKVYQNHGQIKFQTPFLKTPRVRIALSGLDLPCDHNWRFNICATNIARDGFVWNFDGWSATNIWGGEFYWVAFE